MVSKSIEDRGVNDNALLCETVRLLRVIAEQTKPFDVEMISGVIGSGVELKAPADPIELKALEERICEKVAAHRAYVESMFQTDRRQFDNVNARAASAEQLLKEIYAELNRLQGECDPAWNKAIIDKLEHAHQRCDALCQLVEIQIEKIAALQDKVSVVSAKQPSILARSETNDALQWLWARPGLLLSRVNDNWGVYTSTPNGVRLIASGPTLASAVNAAAKVRGEPGV